MGPFLAGGGGPPAGGAALGLMCVVPSGALKFVLSELKVIV